MAQNTKTNLLLSGKKKSLREKQGALSKSQMTTTTQRLSQNSLFSSSNYRDMRRTYNKDLTENMSQDFKDLYISPSSRPNTLLISSLNGTTESIVNGFGEQDISNHCVSASTMKARPRSPAERQWYTRPVHLDHKQSSVLQSSDLLPLSSSLVDRRGSTDSANINRNTEDSSDLSEKEMENVVPKISSGPAMEEYIKEYYPVTLGFGYLSHGLEIPSSGSVTLSARTKGIERPGSASHKGRRTRSSYHKRSNSAHSSSSSNSRNSKSSLEKMYFVASEIPVTSSAAVLLPSPYQQDLAHLRMERLRIEEEQILEVKRQDELERIRGPQKKWYELKTPEFHYEAAKNTTMLKNEKHWQDLLDYRTELERASKDFQETHNYSLSNGTT